MRKIGDNKRAVSLIVSYVLLITIGIALSGMVYTCFRERAFRRDFFSCCCIESEYESTEEIYQGMENSY